MPKMLASRDVDETTDKAFGQQQSTKKIMWSAATAVTKLMNG